MKMSDANDPRWLWVGLPVALLMLAWVLWRAHEPTPKRLGQWTVNPLGETLHADPDTAPCDADRVMLACDRWAQGGWPRCVASAYAGTVEVVPYRGGEAVGAVARGYIGVRPGHCGVDDPTLEHEIGHLLYDLAHTSRPGSVMCRDAACVGFDIPAPGEGAWP